MRLHQQSAHSTTRFTCMASNCSWWTWASTQIGQWPWSCSRGLRDSCRPGIRRKATLWKTRFPFPRKVTQFSGLKPTILAFGWCIATSVSAEYFPSVGILINKFYRVAHGCGYGTRTTSRRTESDGQTAEKLSEVQQLQAGGEGYFQECSRFVAGRHFWSGARNSDFLNCNNIHLYQQQIN